MIDLHVKTRMSTGQMSVYRLLKTIDESDIKFFSIVDKNHAQAYNLVDLDEYNNLIVGTSINTYYKNRPIDLLGYDIDHNVINDWFEKFYSTKNIEEIEIDRFDRIVEMLSNKGFSVEADYPKHHKLGKSIKVIFNALIKDHPDFIYKNERDFRLYGLNNPDSDYFLDQIMYLPSLDQSINLIKKAGGKVFLSHPFEYRSDVGSLLEMVIEKDLDGVEVYHASISVLNSLKLIEFCEASKKDASIGSGFVGNEEYIPLGVHLDEEILEKKCFDWIFNR